MSAQPARAETTAATWMLIVALVTLRFALPLLTRQSSWGIHRDEFLYFAMADHFDLFRMQFPPMIAAIAGTGRAIFGDSVLAARVPAALGGAALTAVVLCAVRRLGGGTLGCLLAWLAMLAAPLFVRTSLLMQPVIVDQLLATVAIAALTLAAHEREPRWWIAVGVGLGLGALNKFSIAFVGASVAVAVLCDPSLRGQLRTRWPWYAVLIGATLSLPSVTGQIVHGWPFLQQMQSLRDGQLDRVTMSEFLSGQLTMLAGALVCVLAAVASAMRGGARERVPVIAAACLVLLMLAFHGKAYYAGPAYPMLVATGALALERLAERRRVVRYALPTALLATTIMLWPIGIPVFSPAGMMRYTSALGIAEATKTNRGETLQLPQDYADMLGWRELADSVGAVIARLPASERADLTLVGGNYGEAGALAFYRTRAGLPYPVSTAGDFWAWGSGTGSGRTVIVVGDRDAGATLGKLFARVDVAMELTNPLLVPEEQRVVIYRAADPRAPIAAIWPSLGPNWR
ncbi:MAG: glycosyltransferase family 39 protein [Gemmatimonadaceae bacterium]|nr:glycosyltransferase family 39 protein [Gemmatimonadaceae bacterium]